MTTLTPPRRQARNHRAAAPRPRHDRRWVAAVGLVAALVAVAWLPFLHAPLTSDESGFLLLGRHLSHGTSLYGDYWVDRPPLLIWLFGLAGHLGPLSATAVGVTAPAVKLMGAAASGVSVLLVGVLASRVAPASRWPRRAAVTLAAVLLASPLFGMPEADGELLALPFVLGGLAALVAALRDPGGHRSLVLATLAGASGACALLVKQNVVDVLLFAAVAWFRCRRRRERTGRQAAAFAGGALAVVGTAVVLAALQGTSPAGLWDAVVVFRLHASAVIGSSATRTTTKRLSRLVQAFVRSGAAAVLVVSATLVLTRARRRAAPTVATLRWPVLAMLGWELVGVAGGGSYRLHYLTGLVPGLALLLCLAVPASGRARWAGGLLAACLVYATAANVLAWGQHATAPAQVTTDDQVISYLRGHAGRSDGVVVAFGHPDIVTGSGLHSPYPQLWSLPVRVDDPRLQQLEQTLSGPDAPRWVVVAGDSVGSWGLDAAGAQRYLQEHYVEQATYGDWHIWQREGGIG
jgi:hypothetical protein